jgi:hypothetical protein
MRNFFEISPEINANFEILFITRFTVSDHFREISGLQLTFAQCELYKILSQFQN